MPIYDEQLKLYPAKEHVVVVIIQASAITETGAVPSASVESFMLMQQWRDKFPDRWNSYKKFLDCWNLNQNCKKNWSDII